MNYRYIIITKPGFSNITNFVKFKHVAKHSITSAEFKVRKQPSIALVLVTSHTYLIHTFIGCSKLIHGLISMLPLQTGSKETAAQLCQMSHRKHYLLLQRDFKMLRLVNSFNDNPIFLLRPEHCWTRHLGYSISAFHARELVVACLTILEERQVQKAELLDASCWLNLV
jgi:hypothetical protein